MIAAKCIGLLTYSLGCATLCARFLRRSRLDTVLGALLVGGLFPACVHSVSGTRDRDSDWPSFAGRSQSRKTAKGSMDCRHFSGSISPGAIAVGAGGWVRLVLVLRRPETLQRILNTYCDHTRCALGEGGASSIRHYGRPFRFVRRDSLGGLWNSNSTLRNRQTKQPDARYFLCTCVRHRQRRADIDPGGLAATAKYRTSCRVRRHRPFCVPDRISGRRLDAACRSAAPILPGLAWALLQVNVKSKWRGPLLCVSLLGAALVWVRFVPDANHILRDREQLIANAKPYLGT